MKISQTEPPAGHRASVGAQRSPTWPGVSRGAPRGSAHHSCTNTAQLSDPLGQADYELSAALEIIEGRLFLRGRGGGAKTNMPQTMTHCLVLL